MLSLYPLLLTVGLGTAAESSTAPTMEPRYFDAVEGTELQSAQVPIEGGQHTLESPMPFGVTVYGYAKYTSYMVAGGFDLNLISPPD